MRVSSSRIEGQARELFAPLGPTYDRVGATLSLGQDPRWRRFLVSRLPRGGHVLDVLLSLAQRALSTHVRYVRRRVVAVHGELELADGGTGAARTESLTAAADAALPLLSLTTVMLAATLVAFRI